MSATGWKQNKGDDHVGTIAHFMEEARACRVAYALRDAGHGVLWRGNGVVTTSASKRELREVATANPGVVEEWYKCGHLDEDKKGGAR